jgi:adenylate kinase
MTLRLVLFGRQGAGKGTQCDLLVQRYGAAHISTGDMLRQAVADGTELGLQAKALMDTGELLPDDLIVGVVRERLASPDVVASGWILDGFPRTRPQAEALLGLLGADGFDLALNIDVPLDIVRERMLGRGRADDNDDAIARRLELYEEETVPAIELFAADGSLRTADGVGDVDEVFGRITAIIDEVLSPTGDGG